MKIQTKIQAGGLPSNHSAVLVRATGGMKVRTKLQAGGLPSNHSAVLVRAAIRKV